MVRKLSLSMLIISFLTMLLNYSAFAKWVTSHEADLDGYLRGIHFINENKGWAVGDYGTLLSTSNGGATWDVVKIEEVKQSSDVYSDLWDVYFADEKNGWVVGTQYKGSAIILYTKDGGKRWDRQSSGVSITLYGVYFIDNKIGWAVGDNGTILGTQTGGSKWTPLVTGRANANIGEGDPGFWDVHFIDAKKGWVAGANGTIKMTNDGGVTWATQITGADTNMLVTDSNLSAIDFVNEKYGWAVGEGGVILNTTDGGTTWKLQESGVTEWLHGVDFINENEGLVSGEYGTILRTTDGGKTWKVDTSGKMEGAPKYSIYDVVYPKEKTAYAASEWGLVLKYNQ